MNTKFLYDLAGDTLIKHNMRKKMHGKKLFFFLNNNTSPIYIVDITQFSSLYFMKNYLEANNRLEFYDMLSICIECDNENFARSYAKGYIKVNNNWYELPSSIAWRLFTDNTRLPQLDRKLSPVGQSYYGRDCCTYGSCPICGQGVQNGMGGTHSSCPRCKQPFGW